MKVAKYGLALAALLAGPAAMAQTVLNPQSGPSDIFLVVWDTANSNSVVFNTGMTVDGQSPTFNASSSYSFSNIDGGLSTLSTDLNGAAQTTWQYAVFTANDTTPSILQGYEANVTTNQGAGTVNALQNQDVVNASNAIGTFISNNGSFFVSGGALLKGNASVNVGNSEWLSTVDGPTSNVGGTPLNVGAAPGTGLAFYTLVSSDDSAGDSPTVTAYSGNPNQVWNFNTGGNDTLTWNPTAVPLPPAAWLLLTGLLGVGAISRRRGGATLTAA